MVKRRSIATLRQFDDYRILNALSCVILEQPSTEPSGFAAYCGVLLRVITGLAPEYLNADDRFLEVAVPAFQMPLDRDRRSLRANPGLTSTRSSWFRTVSGGYSGRATGFKHTP